MPYKAGTFGEGLAILRERKGLTQEELAAKTGISRGHLGNLERNRAKPSNGALTQLIIALQIDGDALRHMMMVGTGKRARPPPARKRPRPPH